MRLALCALIAGGLFVGSGCDASGPEPVDGPASAGSTVSVYGTVFVNDGDDLTPEESQRRESGELGIAQVLVEAVAPGGDTPVATALTSASGAYRLQVPAGDWVIRITAEPANGAFNPTLFHAYDPAGGPAERTVNAARSVRQIDFGFDPDLLAILHDLTEGDFVTDARPLSSWRSWVRGALAFPTCPDREDWVCRDAIETYLAAIYDGPEGTDPFFGLRVPYQYTAGETALREANSLLSVRARSDEEALLQEVLVMELNVHAELGGPSLLYDRTLLYYMEQYLAEIGTASVSRRSAEARVMVQLQLQVARAFNGGGGGGESGD